MRNIVLATLDMDFAGRLSAAVDDVAIITQTEPEAAALAGTVARIQPDLVVIDPGSNEFGQPGMTGLIERTLEINPAQVILSVSREEDTALVLAAIRAGARDVVDRHFDDEQLRSQVLGHLQKGTRRGGAGSASVLTIVSGQLNGGESLFAVNLAVLRAKQGRDVLLIDCAVPSTDVGMALDIDVTYTLREAIHDLRRMDRTLLDTTLGRHQSSGLQVLPLTLSDEDVQDISPTDMLAAFKRLYGMYGEIILNIGGIRHAGLVADLIDLTSTLYLLSTQRLTAVKACKQLLDRLEATSDVRDRVALVVADYHEDIVLSDRQIMVSLGLKKSFRLPSAPVLLANALNKGQALVLDQPRSPYARAMARIAGTESLKPPPRRWSLPVFRSLFGRPIAKLS
jgi:pilus assembly protein CpaE